MLRGLIFKSFQSAKQVSVVEERHGGIDHFDRCFLCSPQSLR